MHLASAVLLFLPLVQAVAGVGAVPKLVEVPRLQEAAGHGGAKAGQVVTDNLHGAAKEWESPDKFNDMLDLATQEPTATYTVTGHLVPTHCVVTAANGQKKNSCNKHSSAAFHRDENGDDTREAPVKHKATTPDAASATAERHRKLLNKRG